MSLLSCFILIFRMIHSFILTFKLSYVYKKRKAEH